MATDQPQQGFQDPTPDHPWQQEQPAQATSAASVEAFAPFEPQAFLAGVDAQVLAVKRELEQLLHSLCRHDAGVSAQAAQEEANIAGVGISVAGPASTACAPGDPVLEVYTLQAEPHVQLCSRLSAVIGDATLAQRDFPMQVVHTGVIRAQQQHRQRLRPAPGGSSCGHFGITAGTLGCLVRGRGAPRSERLMVLSNNHVLANSNAAALGAAILQPGPADGGKDPDDQIARLERFVPIAFGGEQANAVDAATAWAWSDRVRPELMYGVDGEVRHFRVGGTPVAAVPGLQVGKSGRTTELTRGAVAAVDATINVSYGEDRVAHFANQIAVRAEGGDFSAGGDSGSLIWTWDAHRAPVALLFAGGGGTTFGNPIARVLAALDVELVS